MNTGLILVTATVAVALIFDFLNGFHDAANSIATVVSTRVLSPKLAVFWAATFNFLAAFILGTRVAKTIGSGMIHLDRGGVAVVTQWVVIAGLLGAIVWDLVTWVLGLPTSSSHALIGAYAGAAIAKAGFGVIHPVGLDKDADFHRGRADNGICPRFRSDGCGVLDVPQEISATSGRVIPQAPTAFRRSLQSWAWRQ